MTKSILLSSLKSAKAFKIALVLNDLFWSFFPQAKLSFSSYKAIHFDDFDEQNVDDYEPGGYGDIADEILERGMDEQIIEESDLD